MTGSVNRVILIGNLGRDPEIRATQGGDKIVNLNLATSDNWKDKSGERQERTEWHKVVVFNDRIAETAEKYLKRGSRIYIEGSLQTRKWTDKDGAERYSTEVVIGRFNGQLTMLDSGGERAEPRAAAPRPAAAAPARAGGPAWDPSKGRDLDDEIPF